MSPSPKFKPTGIMRTVPHHSNPKDTERRQLYKGQDGKMYVKRLVNNHYVYVSYDKLVGKKK